MLTRTAEKQIERWIQRGDGKTALMVTGARQVGKTWSIRQSLRCTRSRFLEINLIERPDLVPVLEQCVSVEDLVANLSAVLNYRFERGKTILFLDEIQEFREVITRIKFWVDEGSFRYVLSGSLLGVELRGLRSAPVGYLEEVRMTPLNFEEFLLSSGVLPETMELLRDCFSRRTPVPDAVHQVMMKHFTRYLVVGGMPAAVQEYVDSHDISRVTEIQQGIIRLNKLDFTKYEAEQKRLMLISVYDQVASQLLKQNRRFNYSDLKKGLRFERVEDSFLWLAAAGVVLPVYNATEPRVALNQNKKSSLLKLYLADVGLLTCQYGNAIRMRILTEDRSVNLGGIYENAVAQELTSHGFSLYYYNSHQLGELDFIFEQDLSVVPVEVKSGKDYYTHSAISNVIANQEFDIHRAYVLANCNLSGDGVLQYLPVYMTMLIRDEIQMPVLPPL